MRFETDIDLKRELKAIRFFCEKFDLTPYKLGENDIDFKLVARNGRQIGIAEVKGRLKNIDDAYPLPLAVRKISKMTDSHINPVLVYACNDGIIFGRLKKMKGNISWGGRKPREGSVNDLEMMAYFDRQNCLNEIRYSNE